MKTLLELITIEMETAFEKAGYERDLAKVTLSNRPDLCEYQCNGAMAGAKKYKKAPFMIADDVAAQLKESACFFFRRCGETRLYQSEACACLCGSVPERYGRGSEPGRGGGRKSENDHN